MQSIRRFLFYTAIFLMLSSVQAFADESQEEDTTESPHFALPSAEDVEKFPLRETDVAVQIAGVVADVRVRQTYQNNGQKPIEATYVFPGSSRSAVYGMTMKIGERIRFARIQERNRAKAEYQKAKREGKNASLLEQHRPNVFQMSVSNIMPGDTVEVELLYTELLVPENGQYEFVYPTVVGPRYEGQKGAASHTGEQWTKNPHLAEEQEPSYQFNITAGIQAGIPIGELRSRSHKVSIEFEEETEARVTLSKEEALGGNRDFILQYRLQGSSIETGLLLYQGKEGDENFFLALMQPPKVPTITELPPREFIYIVDVSGSMYGFPLETSKVLLRGLLQGMREKDTFNVLLFAASSSVLSELSIPVTPANVERAIAFIDSQHAGGGTELLPALEKAFSLPKNDERSRTIVIATDGYVSVETSAFDLIANRLNKANVFAFGIGSSVNRYLIEGIARVGFGLPFVVTRPEEAKEVSNRFLNYISTPVLSGLQYRFEGFDAYDIEPKVLPDVMSERPVLLFGKWRGAVSGTLDIDGHQAKTRFRKRIPIAESVPSSRNAALRSLWARHRIATLGDYNRIRHSDERVQAITNLGLQYSLLTAYTSFIAVDEVLRNTSGNTDTVAQPLPLPQGVSESALGASVPTVPEPETYALLLLIGLILIWQRGWRSEKAI